MSREVTTTINYARITNWGYSDQTDYSNPPPTPDIRCTAAYIVGERRKDEGGAVYYQDIPQLANNTAVMVEMTEGHAGIAAAIAAQEGLTLAPDGTDEVLFS